MSKVTKCGQSGLDLIKHFEGFQGKPYRCPAGVPTIGYGATYYPGGRKVTLTDPAITEQQATELLLNVLGSYEQGVDSFCRDDISQNQFDALTSFSYNLGLGSLKSSTLLKKVNNDPNDTAIRAEFMKWTHSAGQVLPGLVTRRGKEADLYFGVSR
jgi:lysozyme